MHVVYLFYDERRIVIPFYDYDNGLFKKLMYTKLGDWDYRRHAYEISPRPVSEETLDRVLDGMIRVKIGKDPDKPAVVQGFLEAPWANLGFNRASPLPGGKSVRENSLNDRRCLIRAMTLPERFTKDWIDKLETELHARKYSPQTIGSYVHYNKAFCRVVQKGPKEILSEDIREYLAYLDKTQDLSASSVNLAISALKFFYTQVLKRDFAWDQYSRPRHDKRLPSVLSGTEINLMLNSEKNPKHRLLLMLAYSSGLRVSEVVALKKSSIDLNRKLIFVYSGKGRKDRYTLLSERAAKFLEDYCALYDIDGWLFPGLPSDRHLSIRSAQNIFSKALEKAHIQKQLSIHSLRHTFATHLLENGTDIKYIQELLGHASVRTTERYTHVARRHVLKIQSPLDTLAAEE
ncbi:tyrosine-type recombinase/integrase [Treponema sp. TIM-1]|uniref:tyrosine-type recombinase/integrase n=1 Tax=Treponema sp. TIM-1 TaxID=2898417 RepID=UPI00397F8631